jgi:hypothetical protein
VPTFYEHIQFQKQKRMAAGFRGDLTTAMDQVKTAPDFTDNTKTTSNIQTKVYMTCQILNQDQRLNVVHTKAIPNTEWSIFYSRNGANNTGDLLFLMIGKIAGNTLTEFFNWVISNENAVIFAGNWAVPNGVDRAVDMNYPTGLIFDHDNKHFGADLKASQYTIGNTSNRKKIVRGMEEKAIEHGYNTDTEAYFNFSVNVGVSNGFKNPDQLHCIRVDSPGASSQHSHPIPETGVNSHDEKIKTAIRYHTTKKKLSGLVQLAKYLTLLRTPRDAYHNLRVDKDLYGDKRPPICKFWTW